MKKRKIEIAITILISLSLWVYFYMNSEPLERMETIVVVGVIFVVVFLTSYIIRKLKKSKVSNES